MSTCVDPPGPGSSRHGGRGAWKPGPQGAGHRPRGGHHRGEGPRGVSALRRLLGSRHRVGRVWLPQGAPPPLLQALPESTAAPPHSPERQGPCPCLTLCSWAPWQRVSTAQWVPQTKGRSLPRKDREGRSLDILIPYALWMSILT